MNEKDFFATCITLWWIMLHGKQGMMLVYPIWNGLLISYNNVKEVIIGSWDIEISRFCGYWKMFVFQNTRNKFCNVLKYFVNMILWIYARKDIKLWLKSLNVCSSLFPSFFFFQYNGKCQNGFFLTFCVQNVFGGDCIFCDGFHLWNWKQHKRYSCSLIWYRGHSLQLSVNNNIRKEFSKGFLPLWTRSIWNKNIIGESRVLVRILARSNENLQNSHPNEFSICAL